VLINQCGFTSWSRRTTLKFQPLPRSLYIHVRMVH